MVRQLRLNSHENARRSFNRIAQAYLRDEISTEKARTLAYLLNGILQYWRLAKDSEIEARLEAIEDQLSQNGVR